MPFAFLIVGLVMVIASVRGTSAQLFSLLKNDFTGTNSFTAWLLAILAVGSLGYIKPLQPLSRGFLVLLVIVLLLSNGGFFEQFEQQYFSKSS